jgi:hypothetical protein
MSVPSKLMVPALTPVRRRIIRPMVLLPLPLSPMREITSPGWTWKLTSRTAVSSRLPKVPIR